jgi:hypothetical protein
VTVRAPGRCSFDDERGTVGDSAGTKAAQDRNIIRRLTHPRDEAAMEAHPPHDTLLKLQWPF